MFNWYLGLSTAMLSLLFVLWDNNGWANTLLKFVLFTLAMMGWVLNLVSLLAAPELLTKLGLPL